MKQIQTFFVILSLFALLTACVSAQDSTPSVTVSDQAVDGSVTVESVVAEQEGFIVIHRADATGDAPLAPSSIGHAPVSTGDNADVAVTLDESVSEGDTLFAMLHTDSNGNGVYEFGPNSTDVDTPVTVDGEVVVQSFVAESVTGGSGAAGVIVRQSAKSVEETQAQLEAAIDNIDGLMVMTVVDHAANAESAGLELRPTRVVIFGNPNLGTPLMQAQQTVAIDLPQKLLIYEDEVGDVFAAYNSPFYLQERHGIEGQAETLNMVANALNALAKAATAE